MRRTEEISCWKERWIKRHTQAASCAVSVTSEPSRFVDYFCKEVRVDKRLCNSQDPFSIDVRARERLRARACMCVCVCVRAREEYSVICLRERARARTHTHTHTHPHTHKRTPTHTRAHARTNARTHAHTHARTHTHTHTHTHSNNVTGMGVREAEFELVCCGVVYSGEFWRSPEGMEGLNVIVVSL